MFNHTQIWRAIDALAERNEYSPSALAKIAGLDPTTFNKSKRVTSAGKPRWPSTESLAKVLDATGSSLAEFVELIADSTPNDQYIQPATFPPLGLAEEGADIGSTNDPNFTQTIPLAISPHADATDPDTFLLEVSGNAMEPLYRHGDRLIISHNTPINPSDRIIVKTVNEEILARLFVTKTKTHITVRFLTSEENTNQCEVMRLEDIDWTARIIWASQ